MNHITGYFDMIRFKGNHYTAWGFLFSHDGESADALKGGARRITSLRGAGPSSVSRDNRETLRTGRRRVAVAVWFRVMPSALEKKENFFFPLT